MKLKTEWGQDERVEGAYYWVTDGKRVTYAVHRKDAAGGWRRGDIWEDFFGEVIAWIRIYNPAPPKNKK